MSSLHHSLWLLTMVLHGPTSPPTTPAVPSEHLARATGAVPPSSARSARCGRRRRSRCARAPWYRSLLTMSADPKRLGALPHFGGPFRARQQWGTPSWPAPCPGVHMPPTQVSTSREIRTSCTGRTSTLSGSPLPPPASRDLLRTKASHDLPGRWGRGGAALLRMRLQLGRSADGPSLPDGHRHRCPAAPHRGCWRILECSCFLRRGLRFCGHVGREQHRHLLDRRESER